MESTTFVRAKTGFIPFSGMLAWVGAPFMKMDIPLEAQLETALDTSIFPSGVAT